MSDEESEGLTVATVTVRRVLDDQGHQVTSVRTEDATGDPVEVFEALSMLSVAQYHFFKRLDRVNQEDDDD